MSGKLPTADEYWGAPAGAATTTKPIPSADEFWGPVQEPKKAEPGVVDRVVSAAKKVLEPSADEPAPAPRARPTPGAMPWERTADQKRVVENLDKPALDQVPADAPPKDDLLASRGNVPLSKDTFDNLKRSLAAMPREQRQAQLSRSDLPGWMASAMATASRQIDRDDKAAASTGVTTPFASQEARADTLIKGGMRGDVAGGVAQNEALRGGVSTIPVQAKAPEATTADRIGEMHGETARRATDFAASAAQMLPQTLKLGSDIAQLVTLGGTAPISKALQDWSDSVGREQSYEARQTTAKFQQMMQNGQVGAAQIAAFLAQNPEFAVNTAIPSMGSMLVGMGGAKVGASAAEAVAARAGLVGRELAEAAKKGAIRGATYTNAAMNAGDTFDQTDGNLLQKYGAAAGAAAGTALVGRLTDGGLEAQMAGGAARRLSSNQVADVAGRTAKAVGKESAQEFGEQLSQDASQALAEGKPLDANTLLKSATAAGIQGGILGAGGVFQSTNKKLVPLDSIQAAIDEVGRRNGMHPKAAQALREAIVNMEPEQAISFVDRALGGYERRGLVTKPGAVTGFRKAVADTIGQNAQQAADMQPPPAPPGSTPPTAANRGEAPPDAPLDAGALLGTPLDEQAHGAATSPTNDRPEPTPAQKEAGNYPKGHIRLSGLDISIENPQGSTRRGVDQDGTAWENELKSHYGYIRNTEGADGDHVDTFIKAGTPLDYQGPVFVVDQRDPKTGAFDEHKVMLGFDSPEEANAAYHANYHAGWNGLGYLTGMDMPAFKGWVASGNHKAPFNAGFKETPSDKPDVAAAAPGPVGAGDGTSPVAGGSGGAVRPDPDVGSGTVRATATPEPGSGTVDAVGAGDQPNTALSDTPDFKTSFPRPQFDAMAKAGRNSMFNGMEDDDAYLAQAVRGVHEETVAGVTTDLMTAALLRDGLESGTDPATGKPAKLERLQAMQDELSGVLTNIDGTFQEYAAEFGDQHAQAFRERTALTLEALRKPVEPKSGNAAGLPPAAGGSKRADALKKLGGILGAPNAAAPVNTPAPAQAGPTVAAAPDEQTAAPDPKEARRAAIKGKLAKLQAQYEKKSSDADMRVPPPIRASALEGITKKMNKLEAELRKLDQAPPAARAKKAAKGIKTHPSTVNGSKLLAEISRQKGGLAPSLMKDLSIRKEIGLKDKNGKNRIEWFNPPAGKGIGGLFREGGILDMSELSQWMEEEGYIAPGTSERDHKEASDLARDLIKQAIEKVEPLTMDEQVAQARAEQEAERAAYYADLEAAEAEKAEELRRFLMGEAGITAAEMDIPDDAWAALDNPVWDGPATLESLLESFGWSDQEITDAILEDRAFADANEQARRSQEADAVVAGQETGQDGPSGPQAPADAGAPAPRPANGAEEGLTLEAQTPEALQARADREEAAAEAERELQRVLAARDAKIKRERDKAELDARKEAERKARADAARDGFELGQEPPSATVSTQQAAGQGDIFAAPPAPPAAPPIPAGYKPAGEPYYKDGALTQGYAQFAVGDRVRLMANGMRGAVVGHIGAGPIFERQFVKFDDGHEYGVTSRELEAEAAPAAPAQDEEPAQFTEAQARKQFEWRDLGQKDGVKTHMLFWYEKPEDKGTGAAMGRLQLTRYEGASGWQIDGEGQQYPGLADAKKAAIEVGVRMTREQGWIKADPPSPEEAARATYFTPGNVVKSYGGHAEVLSYTPPTTPGGTWSVRVHAVTKGQASGQWVRIGKPQDARQHSTQPEPRELKAGPVARLLHQQGELVIYTEGRADGRPFPNAPDRGLKAQDPPPLEPRPPFTNRGIVTPQVPWSDPPRNDALIQARKRLSVLESIQKCLAS